MNFKEKYMDAVANKQYNKLTNILVRNLIENFDYKSICDLGTDLCDIDDLGVIIKLDSFECEKLGKNLLISSYYSHPDTCNAFALQIACLERDSDYQTVVNMTDTALLLNNSMIINNIAYANFKLKRFKEAFELQEKAIQMKTSDSNDINIFSYNFMLYDLFFNGLNTQCELKNNLSMLISNDLFDYESAIVLAIFFDDCEFVKNHLDYFKKTFIYGENVEKIINDYISSRKKPHINEIASILQPITCYKNSFYLTSDV